MKVGSGVGIDSGVHVSIPYRFNESTKPLYSQLLCDVSIPYRFNERVPERPIDIKCLAFQFLIGSMKVADFRRYLHRLTMFQFLIGSMKAHPPGAQ